MSATCRDCGQEMLEAEGCDRPWLQIGTEETGDAIYARIRCGDEPVGHLREDQRVSIRTMEAEPDFRCHDCGAKAGEYHHFGCDVEVCSRCAAFGLPTNHQMISCGCASEWGAIPLTDAEAAF